MSRWNDIVVNVTIVASDCPAIAPTVQQASARLLVAERANPSYTFTAPGGSENAEEEDTDECEAARKDEQEA